MNCFVVGGLHGRAGNKVEESEGIIGNFGEPTQNRGSKGIKGKNVEIANKRYFQKGVNSIYLSNEYQEMRSIFDHCITERSNIHLTTDVRKRIIVEERNRQLFLEIY